MVLCTGNPTESNGDLHDEDILYSGPNSVYFVGKHQETENVSISQAPRSGIIPVLLTVLVVIAILAIGAIMLPKIPSAAAIQGEGQDDGGANIAVISGFIPTFGATLGAAGLTELLKSPGPYTVFAPAEGAFSALPAGMLDGLMKPGNKADLQTVIRYHIVPGKFTAADLNGRTSLQTLDGQTLDVQSVDGVVTINTVRITTADMMATNGVIHIIGAVLMPPK